MKKTKFLVQVNRDRNRGVEYVAQIDHTPVKTTPKRNLALIMGKFTAEDVIKSLENARCTTELVPVRIGQ